MTTAGDGTGPSAGVGVGDGTGSGSAPPGYFATGWTGGHNPWVIALVVTMATFMEVLDTSIANVSLPHIAGNLSVGRDESTWVLTSYLVSNAVVLPVSGWLASRVGRKRFYMTCVALFTISSFLCGVAPNLGMLIVFRVLQGVGGGGLGPSEQAILADTFPPAKRGMAFAVYGMAVVLAPAIGPTLGGFITDRYSWRWIFFINVPVGLLSLVLTSRVVTDPPHVRLARTHADPIDYVGLILIALGLGTLEVVLDKGQQDDWFASPLITAFSVTSALALTAFVLWERRHPHPIVDIGMFRNRTFAVANVMMLTLGVALFGSTVLLPLYLQVQLGYSAEQAGMALSPGGFVVMLLLPLVGRLLGRVDPRLLIGFGFVALSGSLFYVTHHLYDGIDFRTAVELRALQSVGLAFLFVPINTLVYAGVPPQKNNAVAGIVNLARNMGGDIGIAFVTTLVARRSQVHQSHLVAHMTATDRPFVAALDAATRLFERAGTAGTAGADAAHRALALLYLQMQGQAATLAFLDAFKVLGVATALMIPLLFLTRRPQPDAPNAGH